MAKVISVEHVTKKYDLGVIGSNTLGRDLNRWWARVRNQPDPDAKVGQKNTFASRGESILALDDVSVAVRQGETLGIIGRNGSGKSTLLKILSRVTAPTSGRVKIKGRIGSLLEVGTGFHPELTGRENIFLNGAILGMKKIEVAQKFDEIVVFSGIEQFIDTPVKRYSSGMYVRLAFAVAAHLDPDILIVDEVLAVGDAEFQKKCLGKMGDVAQEGRTVLFVSHNLGIIQRLCPQAIWLDHGKVEEMGDSTSITEKYLSSGQAFGLGSYNYEDGQGHEIYFKSVELINQQEVASSVFRADEPIKFRITYQIIREVNSASISVMIMDAMGSHLWEISDIDYFPDLYEKRKQGAYMFECIAPGNVLRPGTYRLQLGAGTARQLFHRPSTQVLFEINSNGYWKQSYKYSGLSRAPIVVPMKIERPILMEIS